MAAGPFQDAAVAAANKYGVPVNMFLWQIGKESSWNPTAKNPKSTATGIAQFTEGTAKDFGINPLDPYASLDAAAKYDAMLYKKEGTWQGALTKYGTLHDADAKTLNEFAGALGKDAEAAQTSGGGVMDSLKSIWNNSAFGLYSDTFKNLTGTGTPSGAWDFSKWLGSGTFIVLGIVVVALAILSNQQVKQVVVAAATKGAK